MYLTRCDLLPCYNCSLYWLGHLSCKVVSEMTYNVSSGTLNPTISYHCFVLYSIVLRRQRSKQCDVSIAVEMASSAGCENANG